MSVPADLYGRVGDRLVFPAMAACQHEPERLRRAFLSGTSITATLGIPMTIMLLLLAPEIITFLLGPNWIGVIAPLTVLAAASYFRLGARIGGSVLRATGSFKSLVWAQAGYAAAIIAGGILAAPIGVNAIAAVVSITAGSFFLAMSLLACKRAAISLGTIVFFLRAVNAPDYAILLASGSAIALASALIIRWPHRRLIGAPATALAKDLRAAATARLSRFSASRPSGVKETSA
jgi:PST family polysaccharide transporter